MSIMGKPRKFPDTPEGRKRREEHHAMTQRLADKVEKDQKERDGHAERQMAADRECLNPSCSNIIPKGKKGTGRFQGCCSDKCAMAVEMLSSLSPEVKIRSFVQL